MFDEDDDLDIDDGFDDTDSEDEDSDIEEPPLEFGVDFKTGQMTGGKVKGSKAVAVWAWNALKTPRYRYEQCTWQYGSELSELIGESMDSEDAAVLAESMVRDALLPNPYIEDIDGLTCELDGDKLTISFMLITTFGEEEMENVAIQ